ncbi:MAG: hypothetical protein ABW032_04850 [Burkholderiaceae bacterium]
MLLIVLLKGLRVVDSQVGHDRSKKCVDGSEITGEFREKRRPSAVIACKTKQAAKALRFDEKRSRPGAT